MSLFLHGVTAQPFARRLAAAEQRD
jgi:hypothetical protein